MVVWRKTNPFPSTTCKGDILANLVVITEVTIVFFFAILIVIPVNQGDTVFETVKINTSFFWNFHLTVILAIC